MSLPEGVERRDIDGQETLATRGPPISEEATDGAWRAWDPRRSKLAAMVAVGLDLPITAGEPVLYLGAAAGTTASHVADLAPTYAVEFAPRPARDLVAVAADRDRLFPLLADAREPESYAHVVEPVETIVQDVATRDQADVALANREFLREDGRLALAIKARSVDVTDDPDAVFESELDALREGYEILDRARLDRFHEDHLGVIARPRYCHKQNA
ncbi:fibrillarin-like rRNA/tRNA 2'-O-methyltransferase [Halococcoides cellulosivorans]|uniref:Fibrillarin-like rRNA/tRNA 2'-O-methyltransferase n=1 Tax=Halococcoides cellulosivorans TaxID=1679096 RepID=A0A2R4WZJ4_9EURY|nr:fibrillarin-like rRNA/tRNA 2'-O-methyltransferase [Halococcoides cellulosivorans]AWB26944.1 fibrillin [Halococcoides cellulosivorans]